jgi:hypothetical protein
MSKICRLYSSKASSLINLFLLAIHVLLKMSLNFILPFYNLEYLVSPQVGKSSLAISYFSFSQIYLLVCYIPNVAY